MSKKPRPTMKAKKIDTDAGTVAKASMGVIRRLEKENRKLREALDPFARAYRIMNSLPAEFRGKIADTDGARDHLPGAWPTIADLRRASELLPDNI